MFGNRRRRGSSNPPPNNTNASPSAATAAAQAFLKNQASNASLASAAAGAALRSRPTTPTSVADVQTKRTLRRSGSAASMASSVAGSVQGGPRPSLQRRGSSGSMTERTFRDPSPSAAVPSAPDAPPVPAIPKTIPAIPKKSHRRASSLEAMRVASPPPNKNNGRGSSLGPGSSAQPPRRAGQRKSSLSSVQELTGAERPDSRGSVNFSYPRGSRPNSPLAQRQLTSPSPSSAPRITSPNNQDLVYDPNSRRFIPATQLYALEQSVLDAANKSVKKKKKVAPQQYTGTHLADGTVGGRPHGTAVDEMAEEPSQRPAPPPAPKSEPAVSAEPIATPPKKKKKKVVMASESESDQGSFVPNSSADESDVQSEGFNTRAGALLVKKPSIVREDPEKEEEEDDTPKAGLSVGRLDNEARPVSPTPLPRSAAGRGHGRGQAAASAAFAEGRQHTRSNSQPAPVTPGSSPASLSTKGIGRQQSVSPARTTHFAATPESLVVKHQPPPRSISPRKSALKHANSPRGSSPANEEGVDSSEASNGTVTNAHELSVPKKKAHRVSFDETNVVVGQAATPVTTESPIVQSPQSKKSWFSSIGRGKKNPTATDEEDEVMKPRPALPSFGSVRKNNNRDTVAEERPLVKPAEPIDSASPLPSPTLFTTSSGEVIESPLGQSNDHKVGAVISQDASSKNAANISKSREPLPQSLSAEGSGSTSDTDGSVFDSKLSATVADLPAVAGVPQSHAEEEKEIDPSTIDRESQTPTPTGNRSNGQIPEIAVVQATPVLEHKDKREWPDMDHMPGGWAGSSASDSGSGVDEATPVIEHAHTDTTSPADLGISEPSPVEHQPGTPVVGEIAAENAHAIPAIIEEVEESDASVYDDAAEDLTDGEGDGFQSLNAVVESPVVRSVLPGLALSTPPESPTVRTAKERAYKSSQLARKSSEPDLDEGWGKAQEYWKSLSAEKKRQLEQEARDDPDEAEDSDSTIEPVPKPSKTKKVAVQPVTSAVPVIRQPVSNGERSYMIQPGSKTGHDGDGPVLRSSMRAEPKSSAQDTHIRQSMRGTGSMRNSLRGEQKPQPKSSVSKQSRPVSLPASNPGPPSKHVRNLSEASAAAAEGAAKRDMAPKPKPPMLRRQSSADSDSSFKKARKTADGSNMKRSMRGSMAERPQSPAMSSRFSIRSLSPTGSTFRKSFNPAPTNPSNHMRNSLRASVGPAPSLRAPKPEKTSRLGFARSSSAKPAQKSVRQRASRFADSSDEEDARPAFSSRFADSDDSDNETPAPRSGGFGRGTMRASAPVRAIPKRAGAEDGDSSDLLDSDDEQNPVSASQKLGKNRQNGATPAASGLALADSSLRRSGSGRETMASPTSPTALTRPQHARRGSFMSILRRKKDPASKVRKADVESAARRDTPLERSRSELQVMKRQDSSSGIPTTPKLQKRNPQWPLVSDSPPRILGGEDGRPFTADGGEVTANGGNGTEKASGVARPDLGTRRFTATGLGEVDLGLNGVGTEKKKKKFGKLRRMFRLDD